MPATHMPGMAGEGVTIFQLFSVSCIFKNVPSERQKLSILKNMGTKC